jgi:2,4-dienoyl-CoA reductase-like NADH-dependent reductase (Old Yellow Enzyme family)
VIKEAIDGAFPMIVVGGIQTPEEAEATASRYDMVAIGHELLWEPKWVQKVENGDEKSIRYQLSQSDLADLGITPTMLEMIGLTTGGINNIPFTMPYHG